MQVICPICGEIGLIQTITPRYHRIRHSLITQHFTSFVKPFNVRTFSYHRVSTEWAEQQINSQRQKEEECLRQMLQRQ